MAGWEWLEGYVENTIPATIHGIKVTIDLDVIDSDIPLLLSRREMRAMEIRLDMAEDEIEILGTRGPLLTTAAGHPVINLKQSAEFFNHIMG